MRERVVGWLFAGYRRLRRLERREIRAFRRWIEQTSNLLHLSVLLFVPLLIVVVTGLANAVDSLSFLLFPPLAAGTYTLFANPESRYASPRRFVIGLTVGALCGWVAMELPGVDGVGDFGRFGGVTGSLGVDAVAAGAAVLLTGVATWALDVEEASAFSTALLGLLVPEGDAGTFVVSVFTASAIVAAVFSVWRTHFYEQRARLLYESTDGGDHVVVPMYGENPDETAMLAGRLAAASDAGKVVLVDFVSDDDIARAKRALLDDSSAETQTPADGDAVPATDGAGPSGGEPVQSAAEDGQSSVPPADAASVGLEDEPDSATVAERAEKRVAARAATRLERRASAVESATGVPCQTVAATGRSMAAATRKVAHDTDCDLIAASYEERHGGLSPAVRDLFECELDVLVHRSADGQTDWTDALVPVRRGSDLAHSMLDLAARVIPEHGQLSAASCVSSNRERRRAEEVLANLVETVGRTVETRVSTAAIETFLDRNVSAFDVIIIGASTDRSGASRLVSPPTFERVDDLDADVIIVDRP